MEFDKLETKVFYLVAMVAMVVVLLDVVYWRAV